MLMAAALQGRTQLCCFQAQDVKEEKVVTTKSGLKIADVRIGGGTPVNQGMLVILDYR